MYFESLILETFCVFRRYVQDEIRYFVKINRFSFIRGVCFSWLITIFSSSRFDVTLSTRRIKRLKKIRSPDWDIYRLMVCRFTIPKRCRWQKCLDSIIAINNNSTKACSELYREENTFMNGSPYGVIKASTTYSVV